MRRIARATLLALAALGLFASLALAASVHFKGEQTFTDNGLTLTAAGELAGLGNGDVVIKLSAVGSSGNLQHTLMATEAGMRVQKTVHGA